VPAPMSPAMPERPSPARGAPAWLGPLQEVRDGCYALIARDGRPDGDRFGAAGRTQTVMIMKLPIPVGANGRSGRA